MNGMRLYFCPRCEAVSSSSGVCQECQLPYREEPDTYAEKLLCAILSSDPTRVGMAIDVLTKWMNEPRAVVPLIHLLQSRADAHRLVMAARGLGRLGDPAAVPVLVSVLLNVDLPFVARTSAAQALGAIGGEQARDGLEQAIDDPLQSVSRAARSALEKVNSFNKRA